MIMINNETTRVSRPSKRESDDALRRYDLRAIDYFEQSLVICEDNADLHGQVQWCKPYIA